MTIQGLLYIVLVFALVLGCAFPLGRYMAAIFEGRVTFLAPVERGFYKLAGVDPGVSPSTPPPASPPTQTGKLTCRRRKSPTARRSSASSSTCSSRPPPASPPPPPSCAPLPRAASNPSAISMSISRASHSTCFCPSPSSPACCSSSPAPRKHLGPSSPRTRSTPARRPSRSAPSPSRRRSRNSAPTAAASSTPTRRIRSRIPTPGQTSSKTGSISSSASACRSHLGP